MRTKGLIIRLLYMMERNAVSGTQETINPRSSFSSVGDNNLNRENYFPSRSYFLKTLNLFYSEKKPTGLKINHFSRDHCFHSCRLCINVSRYMLRLFSDQM